MLSEAVFHKLIFCIVLTGSSYSIIAADDNVFPFSNYPMYSRIFEPTETAPFFSVVAEYDDGRISRFDTNLNENLGPNPFLGFSLRDALLVDRTPEVLKKKLTAVLAWHQRVAQRMGFPEQKVAKVLRIHRHDVVWNEFVERRLKGESVADLLLTHRTLLAETR